jgi:hypothetical protein
MRTRIFSLIGLALVTGAGAAQAQFYCRTNNLTLTIIGYSGTNGDVTVPATINDLPVVSIGDFAFQYAYVLTNMTISSGVSYLGNSAFRGFRSAPRQCGSTFLGHRPKWGLCGAAQLSSSTRRTEGDRCRS